MKDKVKFKMQAIKEHDSVYITVCPDKSVEIDFVYITEATLRLKPPMASLFCKGLAGEPETITFDDDNGERQWELGPEGNQFVIYRPGSNHRNAFNAKKATEIHWMLSGMLA